MPIILQPRHIWKVKSLFFLLNWKQFKINGEIKKRSGREGGCRGKEARREGRKMKEKTFSLSTNAF